MKSGIFVIRCCDCDREIVLMQSKELKGNGSIINENISITFKGNEAGIYCECGNEIEI